MTFVPWTAEPYTMRRTLILLAFLPLSLWAQDAAFIHHTPRDQYLFPEEAPPAYVLLGPAPLHSVPDMSGPVIASLTAGERIMVLEMHMDTLELNGVTSHWYRVQAGQRAGWTWGGHIAQSTFGSAGDPSVKFVGGIDHVTPSDTGRMDFSYRIVAIRNGKELDHIVVRSFAWGFGQVVDQGNRGLKNVDDVITLEVPCVGGCGCTTGEVVVFWSGGKFHHVADLMGSPDGAYSTNATFIYPSDMEGVPGAVIRATSAYDDAPLQDPGYGDPETLARILTYETLRWDGRALVGSGAPVVEKRYTMDLDD